MSICTVTEVLFPRLGLSLDRPPTKKNRTSLHDEIVRIWSLCDMRNIRNNQRLPTFATIADGDGTFPPLGSIFSSAYEIEYPKTTL